MKYLLIGAATLALITPAYADSHTSVDVDTVLATVNGTEITLAHLIALRERLPAQFQQMDDATLYQGMLDQIIQQQVLVDAAKPSKATDIGLENETRAYVASQEIDRLSSEPVSEETLQAAYDAEYGNLEAEPEFNASHILVESEDEAKVLIEALDGGADFAELAKENSTGPSGPNGGQLGWFGQGMMVPAFEEAVAGLEPGSVSAPVETQFGWHVIKLNETRQQEAPGLDQVSAELEALVRNAAVETELERLTSEADISRVEIEVDPAMIRQTDLLEE